MLTWLHVLLLLLLLLLQGMGLPCEIISMISQTLLCTLCYAYLLYTLTWLLVLLLLCMHLCVAGHGHEP
jgi:hypothetical protein